MLPTPPQKNEQPVIVVGKSGRRAFTREAFQQKSGLIYTPHLQFASEKLHQEIKQRSKAAVALQKVSIRPALLGKKYREKIEEGAVNGVYIKWIEQDVGLGLFADRDFSSEEYVGEYTGIVRKCWMFFSGCNDYCFRYPLYRIGPRIYTVDATQYCNETSFMNHSDTPNCEAVVVWYQDLFHICIRTLRTIAKDEELTFDYGIKKYERRTV